MKYGEYLKDRQSKLPAEWKVGRSSRPLRSGTFITLGDAFLQDQWIDYSGLKGLIKAQVESGSTGPAAYSPRTTSLTVQRYNNKSNNNEEAFFKLLEANVSYSGTECSWGDGPT